MTSAGRHSGSQRPCCLRGWRRLRVDAARLHRGSSPRPVTVWTRGELGEARGRLLGDCPRLSGSSRGVGGTSSVLPRLSLALAPHGHPFSRPGVHCPPADQSQATGHCPEGGQGPSSGTFHHGTSSTAAGRAARRSPRGGRVFAVVGLSSRCSSRGRAQGRWGCFTSEPPSTMPTALCGSGAVHRPRTTRRQDPESPMADRMSVPGGDSQGV